MLSAVGCALSAVEYDALAPTGKKEEPALPTGRLSQQRRRGTLLLVLGMALLLAACSEKNLPQDSLDPEGPIALKIDNLFTVVVWMAAVIFVLVEAALLYSIFRHRQRKGEPDRQVRQTHGNTRLEVLWTILPAVLLAVIAVPTVATIFDIHSEPKGERIDINVTGHQWWWEFEYPQFGFTTANELHIPADTTVYLNMTSADVIHSFWLPKLNGKRDVVPGRFTNLELIADQPTPADEPLLGQCTEFCGLAHADMRMRVWVDTEEDFLAWAGAQAQPAVIPGEGLAAEGWEIFQRVCSACHGVAGTDAVQRLAPDLTHFAGRTTFGGATFENTTEHLRSWLDDPSALKPMDPDRNDIAAGRILGMPDLGLDSGEIDALIALLDSFE